jgi:hypothetical protein
MRMVGANPASGHVQQATFEVTVVPGLHSKMEIVFGSAPSNDPDACSFGYDMARHEVLPSSTPTEHVIRAGTPLHAGERPIETTTCTIDAANLTQSWSGESVTVRVPIWFPKPLNGSLWVQLTEQILRSRSTAWEKLGSYAPLGIAGLPQLRPAASVVSLVPVSGTGQQVRITGAFTHANGPKPTVPGLHSLAADAERSELRGQKAHV